MQLVTSIIENYQSGLGLNDKIIRYPGHKYQNRPLQSCAINDMFLRSGKQRETDQAGGICWIAMNADWSVFFLLLIQMETWGVSSPCQGCQLTC